MKQKVQLHFRGADVEGDVKTLRTITSTAHQVPGSTPLGIVVEFVARGNAFSVKHARHGGRYIKIAGAYGAVSPQRMVRLRLSSTTELAKVCQALAQKLGPKTQVVVDGTLPAEVSWETPILDWRFRFEDGEETVEEEPEPVQPELEPFEPESEEASQPTDEDSVPEEQSDENESEEESVGEPSEDGSGGESQEDGESGEGDEQSDSQFGESGESGSEGGNAGSSPSTGSGKAAGADASNSDDADAADGESQSDGNQPDDQTQEGAESDEGDAEDGCDGTADAGPHGQKGTGPAGGEDDESDDTTNADGNRDDQEEAGDSSDSDKKSADTGSGEGNNEETTNATGGELAEASEDGDTSELLNPEDYPGLPTFEEIEAWMDQEVSGDSADGSQFDIAATSGGVGHTYWRPKVDTDRMTNKQQAECRRLMEKFAGWNDGDTGAPNLDRLALAKATASGYGWDRIWEQSHAEPKTGLFVDVSGSCAGFRDVFMAVSWEIAQGSDQVVLFSGQGWRVDEVFNRQTRQWEPVNTKAKEGVDQYLELVKRYGFTKAIVTGDDDGLDEYVALAKKLGNRVWWLSNHASACRAGVHPGRRKGFSGTFLYRCWGADDFITAFKRYLPKS